MVRLRADAPMRRCADALIVPLGLAGEISPRLALHQEILRPYQEIGARDFSHTALSREEQIRRLKLKAGFIFEEGWIVWSKDVLTILDNLTI